MTKQKTTLFNALPIVAAAYAERFGVNVVIGGDTAYTNGKSINLPNIPEDYPHKDALWGYLAHEGAHVRFTDFSVHRNQGIHAELTNIIEDCRIEQLMIKAYPGTGKTLLETASYMLQAGHYQVPTSSNHPAQILSAFCLYYLQAHGVGQAPLLKPLAETEKVFKDVFPHGAYVRINVLLRQCIDCKSTQEAANLATVILKMIEEEEEKEQAANQDQNDDQSQGGGQSDDQGDSDSSGDAQQNQSPSAGDSSSDDQSSSSSSQDEDQGQGDAQQNQSPSADDSSSDDQSSSSSSQAQSQDEDEDQGPTLTQQILSAGGADLLGSAHDSLKRELESVSNTHGEANYCTVRKARDVPDVPSSGSALLASSKGASVGIRQQLNGLVQATQRQATRHTRTGRRISTSRLARVCSGETRVFNKPDDKVSPNTAVHILLDMSYSMTGEDSIAKEAAIAIALALETIPGVNPAVTFFYGDSDAPVRSAMRHGERLKADRFHVQPSGCTPMAEALWYAAYELSRCKEERKLIVCITDGSPDCGPSTHKVLNLCKVSGVEAIGIGICDTSVRNYFDNAIVISKATELRTTLFTLMKDSLIAA